MDNSQNTKFCVLIVFISVFYILLLLVYLGLVCGAWFVCWRYVIKGTQWENTRAECMLSSIYIINLM